MRAQIIREEDIVGNNNNNLMMMIMMKKSMTMDSVEKGTFRSLVAMCEEAIVDKTPKRNTL